ncbi:MAG: acetyl-CoA C-acyltransferase [Rhodobiaceae bacterium]|nr:acetyl-CoA C-acyltransferase [Rhodobiaceae bacterium]RPF97300.1 MAG: acetyl-CoA C-acetyltransferase [Rhizobiales bacterium TMED227]
MYKEDDTVIVAASRTAIGSFNGVFINTPTYKLGSAVIKSLLEKSNLDPLDVDEIILGQILTAGQGQNPARQAAVDAGVPYEKPSWLINQLCASGLRAVILAHQQIFENNNKIMIAGGQENMSMTPHTTAIRNGKKMGDITLSDSMINDALIDFFNNYHMGITAENVAQQWKIDRKTQDNFAYQSQLKASKAQESGRFDEEICPVKIKNRSTEEIILNDQYIRKNINIEDIEALRPIFKKEGGTVTAANASGINDGAAGLLLMSYKRAKNLGISPLVKIVGWGQAGVDPSIMGIGPIPAVKNALKNTGWSIDDIDLFELNEAFAAQACACSDDLGIPSEKLNVNGGAIALGHPVGASGARILVTLIHEMLKRNVSKGLASLCVGGGMGVALCVEREI